MTTTGEPVGIPPFVAEQGAGAKRALQVMLPAALRWQFKRAVQWHGRDMSEVLTALVSMYTAAPDAVETVLREATERGFDFGEVAGEIFRRAVGSAEGSAPR